jgi:O-antigen/teichoic acid export membrane protein
MKRAGLGQRLLAQWREPQHRNAWYLALNNVTAAATGLLFWLLLARVANLPAREVGIGYAIVALGTTIGVVAKGGLDTALLRTVPGAHRDEAGRLLRFGAFVGSAVALALCLALALLAHGGLGLPPLGPGGWLMVAAISVLLLVTWLQDAYFLAEGHAAFSWKRNLVLSGARLLLPLPILALAIPFPIPTVWALALAASALAAAGFGRRIPHRDGRRVPRREFLASAARNLTGGAAEFLPGLLLSPIVLAIDGPAAAAYFGIAWTAASLLFLTSAAISRSALADIVRNGNGSHAAAVRRGALQNLCTVAPAAIAGMLLAPVVLSVFGPAYGVQGAGVFAVLCLSAFLIAPFYLYLAVLRAQEKPAALIAFPLAMVLALLVLAPFFEARYGLPGVGIAWIAANAPFALYSLWKLARPTEVKLAPPVGGHPHPE